MSAKDMRQMIGRVRRQGFEVSRTGGNHLRVISPSGGAVTVPSSPSGGRRSLENTRACLRRIGADL